MTIWWPWAGALVSEPPRSSGQRRRCGLLCLVASAGPAPCCICRWKVGPGQVPFVHLEMHRCGEWTLLAPCNRAQGEVQPREPAAGTCWLSPGGGCCISGRVRTCRCLEWLAEDAGRLAWVWALRDPAELCPGSMPSPGHLPYARPGPRARSSDGQQPRASEGLAWGTKDPAESCLALEDRCLEPSGGRSPGLPASEPSSQGSFPSARACSRSWGLSGWDQ